jgi:anthranilate/para-aminobenzoate synthase component I
MTGAPKIAAIQILSDLEPRSRGYYSGAFGYLSRSGTADFGMVIRSAIFTGETVEIGVGGGLTSDSIPEREYDEMLLKAKALLEPWNLQASW